MLFGQEAPFKVVQGTVIVMSFPAGEIVVAIAQNEKVAKMIVEGLNTKAAEKVIDGEW